MKRSKITRVILKIIKKNIQNAYKEKTEPNR